MLASLLVHNRVTLCTCPLSVKPPPPTVKSAAEQQNQTAQPSTNKDLSPWQIANQAYLVDHYKGIKYLYINYLIGKYAKII